jgi:tryptophan synthase alpha chain
MKQVKIKKIQDVFKNNNKALIAYLTLGDPNLKISEQYVLDLAKGGADIIELGIPFSDPVADGETIANANKRALSNGDKNVNINNLFKSVANIRKQINTPLVWLSYINPIFRYGYKKFFKTCAKYQINGVIIPDMPYKEQGEIKKYVNKYNIDIITLISPTSKNRIKLLSKNAKGFVYAVSSLGVTGVRDNITTNTKQFAKDIKENTNTPIAIGFGISTKKQVCEMVQDYDGVIVGSGIVKIIEKHKDKASPYLIKYLQELKSATRN